MKPTSRATGELVPIVDVDDLEWGSDDGALNVVSYPDYEANDLSDLADSLGLASPVACCGRYSAMGRCPDGTELRKVLICRRDWCRRCGAPWSDAHRRRFVDWLPNIQQIGRMGYLVFTEPEQHRPRTRAELVERGKIVTEVLKDWRLSRGVRRWHWFGDLWVAYWQQIEPDLKREAAEAKYSEKTPDDARRDGVVPKWHPHLNVLVDGEDIPTDHDLFVEWSKGIRDDLEERLGHPVNLHYEYADSPAQKVHIAKYILRSTFLDCDWDPQMARELRGFRNTRWWGRAGEWDREQLWNMDPAGADADDLQADIRPELEEIHRGDCPCCHQPVSWGGIERTALFRERIEDDYGGGYYRVRLDVFVMWDSLSTHDSEREQAANTS